MLRHLSYWLWEVQVHYECANAIFIVTNSTIYILLQFLKHKYYYNLEVFWVVFFCQIVYLSCRESHMFILLIIFYEKLNKPNIQNKCKKKLTCSTVSNLWFVLLSIWVSIRKNSVIINYPLVIKKQLSESWKM